MPKQKERDTKDSPALETEEVPEIPALVEPPEVLEVEMVAPAPIAASAKRALGGKEVIPFKWKLVGTSGNVVLTLFKAVDREDVDAQYERALKEGYYTDLRVLTVETKIEQPRPVKSKASAPARETRSSPDKRPTAKPTKSDRSPAKPEVSVARAQAAPESGKRKLTKTTATAMMATKKKPAPRKTSPATKKGAGKKK